MELVLFDVSRMVIMGVLLDPWKNFVFHMRDLSLLHRTWTVMTKSLFGLLAAWWWQNHWIQVCFLRDWAKTCRTGFPLGISYLSHTQNVNIREHSAEVMKLIQRRRSSLSIGLVVKTRGETGSGTQGCAESFPHLQHELGRPVWDDVWRYWRCHLRPEMKRVAPAHQQSFRPKEVWWMAQSGRTWRTDPRHWYLPWGH